MPHTKFLSQTNCPVNFKTQEMRSTCDPYLKMLDNNVQKSTKGQLMVNTELFTEAIKAASKKHKIHWSVGESEIMSPVMEANEDENPLTDSPNLEETQQETDVTDGYRATDYELEPPRAGVLSVRRRNRQFYPPEQDTTENETEDHHPKKVPVFNLGRSLQRLYRKEDAPKTRKADNTEGQVQELDYSSDSDVSKGELYRPLRKIQSLPEINKYSVDDLWLNVPTGSIERSSSIANFTKKWKQENLEIQRGPGFAFLSAVAGNIKDKQAKTVALRADMSVAKADKNKQTLAATSGAESTNESKEIVQAKSKEIVQDKSKEIVQSKSKEIVQANSEECRPVSAPVIREIPKEPLPKKSVLVSMYEWGTKAKTTMTNKEMNMYSPTSF